MIRIVLFICSSLVFSFRSFAQDPSALVQAIREKLDKTNDYRAEAELRTNIPFLKVPDASVQVFYKKPDKIKIKNQNGISLVPKESVSISLYNLVNGKYQVIDGGQDQTGGLPVHVIKLLPLDETADLVLATLYIDVARKLILKARITSRQSGTDEVDLVYGKYAMQSLPDRVVFSFNTQDFKLPKGVTFDYDDGSAKKAAPANQKDQRGKIELDFKNYQVNQGISDDIFK
jgi:hypothetical protein